ncbi:MFS transporter [Psychrobacter sp. JCM 18900]|uniref:MFS transporter n=1 Tax=Psychrobacter sp. JCM 18900 TaxID=1298608 RepID=UPI0004AFE6AD|nr:MFS transporter [Psychrobacter sp. JCM 18900]
MVTLTPTQEKYLPYVLAVALFMQILDATILNTSLPQMAQALGESPLKMQWAVISYALTLAIFIPISGFLADKYGTRRVFLSAVIIFLYWLITVRGVTNARFFGCLTCGTGYRRCHDDACRSFDIG